MQYCFCAALMFRLIQSETSFPIRLETEWGSLINIFKLYYKLTYYNICCPERKHSLTLSLYESSCHMNTPVKPEFSLWSQLQSESWIRPGRFLCTWRSNGLTHVWRVVYSLSSSVNSALRLRPGKQHWSSSSPWWSVPSPSHWLHLNGPNGLMSCKRKARATCHMFNKPRT